MFAARLELVITVDRALCGDEPHVSALPIVLPSPIGRADDLLAVVRGRLERCSLKAPVVALTLRASELARTSPRTLDMLAPEPKADRVLSRLVAELAAEFGGECVGTIALVDTWTSDERTRFCPFGAARAPTRSCLVTSTIEPSRLIRPARVVAKEVLDGAWHIARFEAVAWWLQGIERRDLFTAWSTAWPHAPTASNTTSKNGGALAWLELRASTNEVRLCGWVD
jgi:hypothetical protein